MKNKLWMKKIAMLVLCVLLVWSGTPMSGATAGGKIGFAGGSGTAEAPYIINTAEQLDRVRDHLEAHFRLGADIDLSDADYSDGEGWVPIATGDSFSGSFDGNGHMITGLKIDREDEDYQGLFASVAEAGVIRNVRLEIEEIHGNRYVGGLTAYNKGNIVNSSVSGGSINGKVFVGGLAGIHSGNEIVRSSAAISVSGENSIGGLVGSLKGLHHKTIKISHSYATGEVTGDNGVGGLVGRIETANAGSLNEITNSYATGGVTGVDHVGGLVGNNFAYPSGETNIRNCYATGDVIGDEQTGGLIGFNRTTGTLSEIKVAHCYVTGKVTSSTANDIGGLIGQNVPDPNTIIEVGQSYWNTDVYVDPGPDNEIGTPVTRVALMNRDTFVDWDFTNAWYQYNGHMPFLQWENPITSWDAEITKDTLQIGEESKITVGTMHENNEIYDGTDIANYTASPDIVTIENGKVTAKKGGKATITVSLFGESRTLEVTVTSDNGGTKPIDPPITKPKEPAIMIDPEGWTNADEVRVTIHQEPKDERLSEVKTIRVKVGDTDWQDYAYDDVPITFEVKTEGKTMVQAQAIDKAGNKSEIATTTVKIDRTAPKITLVGDNSLTQEAGTPYDEPGATAEDNVDGDISDNVRITGKVDTNKPGTYYVHYNVSDSSGNKAFEVVREVHVVAPEVIWLGLDQPAVPVYADSLSKVKNTHVSIQLPADLPEGTTLRVETVNIAVVGYEQAGEVYRFVFTYPDGHEDYTGDFALTLGVNSDAAHAAIYYYNEETKTLEYIGGEAADGVITAAVNHFSTYGVFVKKTDKGEGTTIPSEHKNDPEGQLLPKTATAYYSWLLTGGIFILLAIILMWMNRMGKRAK